MMNILLYFILINGCSCSSLSSFSILHIIHCCDIIIGTCHCSPWSNKTLTVWWQPLFNMSHCMPSFFLQGPKPCMKHSFLMILTGTGYMHAFLSVLEILGSLTVQYTVMNIHCLQYPFQLQLWDCLDNCCAVANFYHPFSVLTFSKGFYRYTTDIAWLIRPCQNNLVRGAT